MNNRYLLCTGLLVLGLLCLGGTVAAQEVVPSSGTIPADDIQPYDGLIGPGSPLYGLKLAFEDMDESFAANQTQKIDLQMRHAENRIAEAKKELDNGRMDLADEALGRYRQKMNLTNTRIANWTDNSTGLLHAQEMITKHQLVLERLLETHPGNTGLMHAYNNSQELEERFANKTAFWFNRSMGRDNATFLRHESQEGEGNGHGNWPDMNETINRSLPNQSPHGEHRGGSELNETVNWTHSPETHKADHTNGQQQDDQQGGNGQQGGGQQNGNNNADHGRGNSRTR